MTYYQEFEGIVLFQLPHREKDALVKIFTKEHGKMMFFLKNLQQNNHPLKAASVPFTKAVFLGHISDQGLSFLKDSRDLVHCTSVFEDIYKNAYATYMMHLADAAIEDRITSVALYQLLDESLFALQKTDCPQLVVHYFEIKMLAFFGLKMNWEHCAFCQQTNGAFDFSIPQQSIICSRHFDEDPYRMQMSPKALHIARQLAFIKSPRQLGQVHLHSETLADLKRLMDEIYEEYVGIHLKSKKYIEQMLDWEKKLTQIKK